MSTNPTPHSFPVALRDNMNTQFLDVHLSMLDDNARFILRRMIADSYAAGFQDGRRDETQSRWANDAAKAVATREAQEGEMR